MKHLTIFIALAVFSTVIGVVMLSGVRLFVGDLPPAMPRIAIAWLLSVSAFLGIVGLANLFWDVTSKPGPANEPPEHRNTEEPKP